MSNKLMELPNGNWIDPETIIAIKTQPRIEFSNESLPAHAKIYFGKDELTHLHAPINLTFQTTEEAEEYGKKLGEEVNRYRIEREEGDRLE